VPSKPRHALTGLLVLVALLVRLVVPQGYMIDGSSGSLQITICHSQTVVKLPMAHNAGHGDRPTQSGAEQQPCAYAGFASLDAPPMPASMPISTTVIANYERTERAFVLAQPARQLPPARAPPVTA
jgi:hypothetical protein